MKKNKIIQLMREEYSLHLRKMLNELTDLNVIDTGLRVTHTATGLEYTVDAPPSEGAETPGSEARITLRAPEGGLLQVSREEFEKNYQVPHES